MQFYTHMHGPIFLVVYAFLGVALYLVCMSYRAAIDKAPNPDRENLKPEVDPDPYRLAYLRGGKNEVLRTATFELFSKGMLQEKRPFFSQATFQYQPSSVHSDANLTDFAKEAKRFYQEPKSHTAIFASDVATMFRSKFQEWDAWIEKEGLRIPQEYQSKLDWLAIGLMLLYIAVGLIKLVSAISRGHENVFFGVVLIFIGSISMLLSRSPRRFSYRGREFLRNTQIVNEQYRHNIQHIGAESKYASESFAGSDLANFAPLVTMGLFGVAALQGTDFDRFHKSYLKSQATGAGCGASCAGAAGSCGDASSSSSGCGAGSGGGGCGSGCGGCGGGCGGGD